jgi:hypothetical protein
MPSSGWLPAIRSTPISETLFHSDKTQSLASRICESQTSQPGHALPMANSPPPRRRIGGASRSVTAKSCTGEPVQFSISCPDVRRNVLCHSRQPDHLKARTLAPDRSVHRNPLGCRVGIPYHRTDPHLRSTVVQIRYGVDFNPLHVHPRRNEQLDRANDAAIVRPVVAYFAITSGRWAGCPRALACCSVVPLQVRQNVAGKSRTPFAGVLSDPVPVQKASAVCATASNSMRMCCEAHHRGAAKRRLYHATPEYSGALPLAIARYVAPPQAPNHCRRVRPSKPSDRAKRRASPVKPGIEHPLQNGLMGQP